MVTVRRWYIFLICAISLNAITWAFIALLRNVFGQILINRGSSAQFIALQIAILLVGTPVYLAHWLWAQRLARSSQEERASGLRHFYLIGVLAGFLGPILTNAASLSNWLFSRLPRVEHIYHGEYSYFGEAVLFNTTAVLVLSVFWFYHSRLIRDDLRAEPENAIANSLRRLYVYLFSGAGLTLTSLGSIHLIRWLMVQLLQENVYPILNPVDLTMLLIGVPLWLFFWKRGPRFWTGDEANEYASLLRKFYIYTVVFIAVLVSVGQATIILASFFRRFMGLPSQGFIGGPLPILLVMGGIWFYHAAVLRNEAGLVKDAPRQAGIRRLYLYLIAAIGLAAFLVGLGGMISVLIRSFSQLFGPTFKEQVAWFSAALIAGLPVWLFSWRPVQAASLPPDGPGPDERASLVRKIYLYFYLFIATMTVLSGLVYTVYQILSVILRATTGRTLLVDIGQALAFSLVAVGVWLYHGSALRQDGSFKQKEKNERIAQWHVAVLDTGEGQYGNALLRGLKRELPALNLDPIGLTPAAALAMQADTENIQARIKQASLIIGPASIAVRCGDPGTSTLDIAEIISLAPGHKLLAPMQSSGLDWIGVDRWSLDGLVRQTVNAVKQMINGEEIKPIRPLSAGAIIGIIGVAMWVLPLLFSLVMVLLDTLGLI